MLLNSISGCFRDICAITSVLGSRVWPFGVTWRYWSRDHRPIFLLVVLWKLEPSLYL